MKMKHDRVTAEQERVCPVSSGKKGRGPQDINEQVSASSIDFACFKEIDTHFLG
jgi:hypothetical protein